jgi:hypothetical protein
MKVFLLLFSFMFLVTAANDCCIDELEEGLIKISKSMEPENSDSEGFENSDDCSCSTFCSYTILTIVSQFNISVPSSTFQRISFLATSSKENRISFSIFHPPIA